MTSLTTHQPYDDCFIAITFWDWSGNEAAEKPHIFIKTNLPVPHFEQKDMNWF